MHAIAREGAAWLRIKVICNDCSSEAELKNRIGEKMAEVRRTGGGHAWFVVALLSLLYAVSFVDRVILSLLVEPIKGSLAISDAQMGLLFGLGFVIVYSVAGIPLAHLIDRLTRVRILAAGVLCWGISTFLAGFSEGFTALLVTRWGVAIGEAVLSPAAISLIADLFPRRQQALPTSIYMTVGAVMGTGALIVGAGAIVLATGLTAAIDLEVWRLTLMIVAMPAFLLAAVLLFAVPEPERNMEQASSAKGASLAQTARYAWQHGSTFFVFFASVGCVLMLALSLVAWGPTFLVRDHGVDIKAAGALFGTAAVIGSVAGTGSVAMMIRWLGRAREEVGVARAALVYTLLALPIFLATVRSNNIELVLVGVGFGFFGLSACAVLSPVLVQLLVPSDMRARMVALYFLLSQLISMGIGPLLPPALATNGFLGGGLGAGLAQTALLAVIIAVPGFAVAMRAIGRSAQSYSQDQSKLQLRETE